ncbi:MAG: hypothetical protein GVY23_03655 [Spirochaetes bacterium]|jgi:glucose-6-phosphate dehydrogenase assembly protein OpcA|nr:hypothetical protein [Spirochaetota bacterium]
MTFDPEQIETELAEIQKRNSPTEARTVILNLLVVSDEKSRPRTEQALGAVLGKRAARVIHIVDGKQGESDISLSARCYLDYERKSVCFQEVLIENGADGVGAAPGSWTPLLIRDIPVYVLWLASFGPRPALLDHVQEQADKLIIDSEYAAAAGDATGEIFWAVSGVMLPEGFRISDLTWQRTLPLRRVTAHTFDAEEPAGALFDLEAVELSGAPPMFAALYLGWIASRLGWQPEEGGRDNTRGRAGEGGARGGAGSNGGTRGGDAANPGASGAGAGAGSPGGGAGAGSPGDGALPRARHAYLDRQGRAVRTLHREAASLGERISITFHFFGREMIRLSVEPGGCVSVTGTGTEVPCEVFNVAADGEILLGEIDAARNEGLYLAAFEAARALN